MPFQVLEIFQVCAFSSSLLCFSTSLPQPSHIPPTSHHVSLTSGSSTNPLPSGSKCRNAASTASSLCVVPRSRRLISSTNSGNSTCACVRVNTKQVFRRREVERQELRRVERWREELSNMKSMAQKGSIKMHQEPRAW